MVRKISGGKYIPLRKKKLSEHLGKPRHTTLGKDKKKEIRMSGGKMKTVMLFSETAFVTDPKSKKTQKSKIKSVVKTPANRYFKNIIVKGTIIETEAGKARVTNRPGQEGNIAAVLVSE